MGWLKAFNSPLHLMPGTLLAVVVAPSCSTFFFGAALHYLSADAKAKPGIEFCSRNVLLLGVGLLGARITTAQIVGLGWTTAATAPGR